MVNVDRDRFGKDVKLCQLLVARLVENCECGKGSCGPIVGQTYHLYQRDSGEHFLSIIAPHECRFNAVGSFYLNADMIWEKLEKKADNQEN